MKRREWIKFVGTCAAAAPLLKPGADAAATVSAPLSFNLPKDRNARAIAFPQGVKTTYDLKPWFNHWKPGVSQVRLALAPSYHNPPKVQVADLFPMFRVDPAAGTITYDGRSPVTVCPAYWLQASDDNFAMQITPAEVSGSYDSDYQLVVDPGRAMVWNATRDPAKTAPFRSLQEAINAAGNGDVIKIGRGMLRLDVNENRAASSMQFIDSGYGLKSRYGYTIEGDDPNSFPVLVTRAEENAFRFWQPDVAITLRYLEFGHNHNLTNPNYGGYFGTQYSGAKGPWPTLVLDTCRIVHACIGIGYATEVRDCHLKDCGLAVESGQGHPIYAGAPLGRVLRISGCVIENTREYSGPLPGSGVVFVEAHCIKMRGGGKVQAFGNKILMRAGLTNVFDHPEGGEVEIAGNIVDWGEHSANTELAALWYGEESHHPGATQKLIVRNNTFVWSRDSRPASYIARICKKDKAGYGYPTLDIGDNVLCAPSPRTGYLQELSASPGKVEGALPEANDTLIPYADRSTYLDHSLKLKTPVANALGRFAARKFTGKSVLGTGSIAHTFTTRGAL
jgi:hypothetical protein